MGTETAGDPRPGPWRITFDTNPDDCNLACVMCEEHSEFSEKKQLRKTSHRPHRRMDVSMIRRVVAEMAPRGLREIIPSTMGEPLLYRNFDEIVQVCRDFRIRVNLTTNGTWPGRGPTRWGELLCPVGSDIKVSWNGTTPEVQESIMKGDFLSERERDLGSFLRVRDEVLRTTGNHCRVTLQCTFMEANLKELPSLVRFASEVGADRVKGHHLWVHFGQLVDQDLRRDPDSRRRWNETVRLCLEAASEHPRPDGSRILLENFLPLPTGSRWEPPLDWKCPFLGREVWVNYAGRFDPCCAPDTERSSLGNFGSVLADGGMTKIWDGALYGTLASNYQTRALCQRCTMRRPLIRV